MYQHVLTINRQDDGLGFTIVESRRLVNIRCERREGKSRRKIARISISVGRGHLHEKEKLRINCFAHMGSEGKKNVALGVLHPISSALHSFKDAKPLVQPFVNIRRTAGPDSVSRNLPGTVVKEPRGWRTVRDGTSPQTNQDPRLWIRWGKQRKSSRTYAPCV
jgi:hypothetical protein